MKDYMKNDNGCCALICALYEMECERISADCVAEGYPSHGSNYELRVSGLWDKYYDDWYSEALGYIG